MKETLIKGLLESGLWKNSVSSQYFGATPDVLCDINDGQKMKNNQFSIENPECLKLINYQDAFEIVSPFGSARKKVVAVYLSLTNVPVHVWLNYSIVW